MINTGKEFFHPVTHQLIESGAVYAGRAHKGHENDMIDIPSTHQSPPASKIIEDILKKEAEKLDQEAEKPKGGAAKSTKPAEK